MNRELRNEINNLAEDILAFFEIDVPISNMEEVVKLLGGKLSEKDGSSICSDGNIRKENNNNDIKFEICVPEEQSDNRKNFTVAHELGHLFLHMGYLINDDLWNNFSNSKILNREGNSEFELQANEFAAAFLMPRKLYKEIMDKYSDDNKVLIGKVAEYFNVSIDAASYRGKWLGYLKW